MKITVSRNFAVMGLIIIGLLVSGARPVFGQRDKDPQPVKVVNPTNEPVPVNGTVNVVNTREQPVYVVSSEFYPALRTRNEDDPARNPYAFSTILIIPQGAARQCTGWNPDAGKRIIFEQVSAVSFDSAASGLWVSVSTRAGGSGYSSYSFIGSKAKRGVDDVWIASSQLKLYADTTGITVCVNRDNESGNIARIELSVSGYQIHL